MSQYHSVGYKLLGATAVAAVCLSGCAANSATSEQGVALSSSWTPTPVLTSGWSGGVALTALAFGTLERDSKGCLVNSPGSVLRWPKGFTGRTSSSGVVEVLNADGQVVARTGHPVRVGGGFEPATPTPTGPCRAGYRVFDVEDIMPALAP
jgi:hypothetical protein